MKIVRKFKRLSKRLSSQLSGLIDRESAPLPMLTDLRRNFKVLLVGGTRLWESYRFESGDNGSGSQIMPAALPCRSMEGQWWTVQHMHSYVRKGGTVIMTIDLGDRTHRTRGFSYGDARTFHPLANQLFGLRFDYDVQSHCCKFYPRYSAVLLSVLGRHSSNRHLHVPRFWVRKKLAMNKVTTAIKDAREFLAQAPPFCKERGLRLHSAIILPDNISQKARELVENLCSKELQGIDHALYSNPGMLIERLHVGVSPHPTP